MGRKLVTSYAAMGVGLAIVLTLGLTAISSVVEPSQNTLMANKQGPSETAREGLAPAAPAPAPPPAAQEKTGGSTSVPQTGEFYTKSNSKQEEAKSYSITAEAPAGSFAGLLVVLPYITAAIVGSVVFVVTRKRSGW